MTEDPHAHIVCRNCGRISSVGLSQLDLYGLEVLAERRPAGWNAQAVTYSITGFCPACRGRRPG